MIRLLFFTLLMLCVSGVATAQIPGAIGIFGDLGATDCNIVDVGTPVHVYVFHMNTDGATGSQFKLDVSETGWVHLQDTWNFATVIGTSVDGVAIGYGTCMSYLIYLGVVDFWGSNEPPCTNISIVPDPEVPSGMIEAADCGVPDPSKMFPVGGSAFVNMDYINCNCRVPVEESTWGGIKSLYE